VLPFTVQFENTSTNATSYEWTFPGGNPSTSTLLNPTVVYNTPGKFDVTLVAINGSDKESTTKTQFITV
jgi:PKD repeat protein